MVQITLINAHQIIPFFHLLVIFEVIHRCSLSCFPCVFFFSIQNGVDILVYPSPLQV